MKIATHNDWDPLKEVIVGRADGARIPTVDRSTMSFGYAGHAIEEVQPLEGPLPTGLIEEANEDIEELVRALQLAGVKVHRPLLIDTSSTFSTPQWQTTGWYTWCPRDLLLPLDNLMIETPSPTRARYFETRAYRHIMKEAIEDRVEWISAPKPILPDEAYTFHDLDKPTLNDLEPAFDAANIVRVGRDLLFQISNSGNKSGFQWLRTVVERRGYRLHLAEHIYSFAHLDSTIIPLRPGLVLLNSRRVTPSNCPEIFARWDKIYFADVAKPFPSRFGGIEACSPYIGLNVLSIDPNTICVDKRQVSLIRELERHGMACIALPMRHGQSLSGGFHCVTLDLVRKGSLEDYS